MRLISSFNPPASKTEPAWWFIFKEHKLMVVKEDALISIPLVIDPSILGLSPMRERYLGILSGRHCYYAEVAENEPVPLNFELYGLRSLYGRITEPLYAVAIKAAHLTEWERATRFCGRCGGIMESVKAMNSRECSNCGMMAFPRISPAVIVLVERNGRVLLARARRFRENIFSVLAGFVEPGETLEETIHREIEEEVGIVVKNIRYFGSQPWPFPDSLMIGFTAEYSSGELRVDETEIVEAHWFDPEKLPSIPGKISIARQLIDWFIEGRVRKTEPTRL